VDLEKEITEIQKRNRRVEADKCWETSFTRIGVIMDITLAVGYLMFYWLPYPEMKVIAPAIGYVVSTGSLRWLKDQWIHDNPQILAYDEYLEGKRRKCARSTWNRRTLALPHLRVFKRGSSAPRG
jgi:hypothetical protein